ncbi:unnamed protein product [Penicillium nalgiovense]|nr:unnamed protein product [Penicillium nalgiovense]
MLWHTLKLLGRFCPFALSVAGLICLAIVFAGCTSSSSPSGFYFMKLNLTNFPDLSNLHLRRGLSIAGVDTSSVTSGASDAANSATKLAANEVAQVSTAVQTKADQARDRLEILSKDLRLHLPAYYAVGLWGYCQGDNSTGPFAKCSKPSTSFSFDLLEILGSASEEINDMLPKSDNKVLGGYHNFSMWTILAYILGFIFTIATIIIQVLLLILSKGKIFLIASSILASVFVTSASIGVTVIYGLITGDIKSVSHPLGAHASLGAQSLTSAWLAVVFSISALLVWLIEMCCCCF